MKLSDIAFKYAAIVVVTESGECWLVKPGSDPVRVKLERAD